MSSFLPVENNKEMFSYNFENSEDDGPPNANIKLRKEKLEKISKISNGSLTETKAELHHNKEKNCCTAFQKVPDKIFQGPPKKRILARCQMEERQKTEVCQIVLINFKYRNFE